MLLFSSAYTFLYFIVVFEFSNNKFEPSHLKLHLQAVCLNIHILLHAVSVDETQAHMSIFCAFKQKDSFQMFRLILKVRALTRRGCRQMKVVIYIEHRYFKTIVASS